MNKSLSTLFEGLVTVSEDLLIANITLDSRKVVSGSLFFALAKQAEQRQAHLQQALQQGAVAVAFSSEQVLTSTEKALVDEYAVEAIAVAGLEHQVSEIAARFYDRPSASLKVIAVTGTNGKTSVTHYIAEALEKLNFPCALIGTLGHGRLPTLTDNGMTTPDPISVQAILAECVAAGVDFVALEASSHALDQGRLNAVQIDIAVFTNLTRDHLDYHLNMQAYAESKMRLFKMPSVQTAIVNLDDEMGRRIQSECQPHMRVLGYSIQQHADAVLQAKQVIPKHDGIEFELVSEQHQTSIQTALLGAFNVANLLATAAVLKVLEISPDQISKVLSDCHSVTGRMQATTGLAAPTVVVDYAHTPDALKQVLTALRWHAIDQADLWCVFGCGGDRDRGKRPKMGMIAEQQADHLVITDDNPRYEASQQIIDDILSGCRNPQQIHVQADRGKAIQFAVQRAAQKDIVLIAGKGHETTQEIAGVKYPFNDMQIVSQILQSPNRECLL